MSQDAESNSADWNNEASSDDASADLAAKQKAQARRAQVRRAQIQHRKRKADYIKQLETDVADYRNMIADIEKEVALLRRENEAARARLALAAGLPSSTSTTFWLGTALSDDGGVGVGGAEAGGGEPGPAEIQASYFDIDELMVSFALDEAMGASSWRVSPVPASSIATTSPSPRPALPTVCPDEQRDDTACGGESVPGLTELGQEQTQQAINLILAMEHVCKDHFRPTDFDPDLPEPWPLESDHPLFESSGHQMMATALALREAPLPVVAAMWPNQRGGHLTRKSSGPLAANDGGEGHSWRASGLTLRALHDLATSLAPLADVELTPVQAWFELAARFPPELLLRPDVAGALKRELVGVAKCLHFGAVMERGAFESVVDRILGAAATASASVSVADTAIMDAGEAPIGVGNPPSSNQEWVQQPELEDMKQL